MKRILLLGLALAPVALLANEGAVETDIVQRTVNFIIFAGILWYLLADKIKAFFANRTVEGAKADVDSVKQKVATAVDSDIANLNKNLDEMMKVEISKAKKEVVTQVLEELLSSENIKLTQDELANIVLKKVA